MEQKWACLQRFLSEPRVQYSKTTQAAASELGLKVGAVSSLLTCHLGQAATFGGFCVKCTLWAWLFPYLLTGLSVPSEHPLEGSKCSESETPGSAWEWRLSPSGLVWHWAEFASFLATIITSSHSILVGVCFVLEWLWRLSFIPYCVRPFLTVSNLAAFLPKLSSSLCSYLV